MLGKINEPHLLRSDNGLIFNSSDYTRLVRSYGLRQQFITPHCPQQNGMVERVIRTLKEQCIHRHRFESQSHTLRVIGDTLDRVLQPAATTSGAEAYAAALTPCRFIIRVKYRINILIHLLLLSQSKPKYLPKYTEDAPPTHAINVRT
jgi:hypothetical protein